MNDAMATKILTDRALKAAKPKDTEYEIADGGGLSLRIRPTGYKVWIVRYTSPTTRKQAREYLGSYPEISLHEAREKLQERKGLLVKAVDPRQAQALLADSGDSKLPRTVSDLFDTWEFRHVKVRRRNVDDQRAIRTRYEKYARAMIGSIPLAQVRRTHIMQVLDGARAAGVLRTTNLVLAELGQMFRYAAAREWMQGDPTAAITRKDAGGRDQEGDRILSDMELVMLRDRLAAAPKSVSRYYVSRKRVLPMRTELAVWWTLATAARAVEVASMRKDSVSVRERVWVIPAEVAKNDDAHVVHLSDFALAIWDRLVAFAGPIHVFQGRNGPSSHMSQKEVTRRLTDRQTREKQIKGRKNNSALDLPGGRWTQHDLRRTAATVMGDLGVHSDVIDRCLNHRETKKVTRTYQRQKMLAQRQAAFEQLGARYTQLLGPADKWLCGATGVEAVGVEV